jgi:acetyltransferase-like isoleucine patch superfamily enzyme
MASHELEGATHHPLVTDRGVRQRAVAAWRIGWMVVTLCFVQGLVCGMALFPVLYVWSYLVTLFTPIDAAALVILSAAVIPSYAVFALCLMACSALATRLTGWRTPAGAQLRIADVDWALLDWARYMVAIHIVRLFAGALFRGSPVWTAYLRWAGARLGRRVYVNSLSVSDYNLLEFDDDVVIGEHVHISGHTVEAGVVKTDRVRLGRNVTVGLGSVIDIGVTVGAQCQIGALSLVPKHSKLEPGGVYAGIPVRRIR